MDKENLALKVKELRIRQGFSQEQLAEESALSLRTVQRIEKGETVPHGDTLRKLTRALKVSPDGIMDWAPSEDKGFLILLNLAGLGFILHPLLGVVIPLVLWILKKDKIKLVDDSGRKLVAFQLSFSFIIYSLIFIMNEGEVVFDVSLENVALALERTFSAENYLIFAGAFLIFILYTCNIILIFINLRRNQKGLKSHYFPSIPFLK